MKFDTNVIVHILLYTHVYIYIGSNVWSGGKQIPECRVKALSIWKVCRWVGQTGTLGCRTQCSFRECALAHPGTTPLVSILTTVLQSKIFKSDELGKLHPFKAIVWIKISKNEGRNIWIYQNYKNPKFGWMNIVLKYCNEFYIFSPLDVCELPNC